MEPDGYKSIAESYVKYKEPEKSFFDQVLEAKPDPNARKGNTIAVQMMPAMPSIDVEFIEREQEAVNKALKALMANYKSKDVSTIKQPVTKPLCPICKKPGCKLYW